MEFKIEKNVNIPNSNGGRQCKYPFKEMEVGDSFSCGEYLRDNMSKINNAGRNWSNKTNAGHKFQCRKLDDGTFRIWRVK